MVGVQTGYLLIATVIAAVAYLAITGGL